MKKKIQFKVLHKKRYHFLFKILWKKWHFWKTTAVKHFWKKNFLFENFTSKFKILQILKNEKIAKKK